MRKEISEDLLREQWIAEAVNLYGNSKNAAQDIEEFFLSELKVITFD